MRTFPAGEQGVETAKVKCSSHRRTWMMTALPFAGRQITLSIVGQSLDLDTMVKQRRVCLGRVLTPTRLMNSTHRKILDLISPPLDNAQPPSWCLQLLLFPRFLIVSAQCLTIRTERFVLTGKQWVETPSIKLVHHARNFGDDCPAVCQCWSNIKRGWAES